MYLKSKRFCNKNKHFIFAFMLGAAALLSGCGPRETGAIKIENEIVSPEGREADKAAVASFLQEKGRDVEKLAVQMAANFPAGPITVDQTKVLEMRGGLKVPSLMYNGKSLNNDHAIPEQLAAQTGGAGVATLFVKAGEDFVRVSTSLKRSNNVAEQKDEDRATGSVLNHAHPAYAACKDGKPYSGTATLFGKIYATRYAPIKDKEGRVIGIQFVGLDISSDVFSLKKRLAIS